MTRLCDAQSVDGQLLLAARGGDPEAIRAVCDHYHDRLIDLAETVGVARSGPVLEAAVTGSLLRIDPASEPSVADFERDLFARVEAYGRSGVPPDREPDASTGGPFRFSDPDRWPEGALERLLDTADHQPADWIDVKGQPLTARPERPKSNAALRRVLIALAIIGALALLGVVAFAYFGGHISRLRSDSSEDGRVVEDAPADLPGSTSQPIQAEVVEPEAQDIEAENLEAGDIDAEDAEVDQAEAKVLETDDVEVEGGPPPTLTVTVPTTAP